MTVNFKRLSFEVRGDKIYLTRVGNFASAEEGCFCEVQIAGETKDSHLGVKMIRSSEGWRLRYVSHELCENRLTIVMRSELIEAVTIFTAHSDCEAVQAVTHVKNISPARIVLEEVSALVIPGIGAVDTSSRLKFTRFIQSHHGECQPEAFAFDELGLYRAGRESQKRIAFCNVGSWSTKEELPQGIVYDEESHEAVMFQIESNNSWYYEIGDADDKYYLYLGVANATHGGWSKALDSGEGYRTVSVSLAFGKDMNSLLADMTRHRRHIAGRCRPDDALPSIFNEYMHLSWDSPSAEATRVYAPVVSRLGVEYYVIDCGWHDEEDGNIIYPYVGKWCESNKRFPDGLRATTDFIRSLGMKAGLWIEPEIIGCKCADMLDYYDDSCFLQRHGRKICTMNRYFLDYRNPRVIEYMDETIRRMVEDYGADYIKMDFNQDCGIGTDLDATTPGEGLESHARAYLAWVDRIRERFPDVLFETCSSGGMRMDYATLSHFSIVSTSDQTKYYRYPYIAGNILSAVIPEQAAVWSYPVDCEVTGFTPTREWVRDNVSCEQIIMNMINSFLGRMHLASHLELLGEEGLRLVEEGVKYYDSIRECKRVALPYMPLGFTRFGRETVACGLLTEERLLLAVWRLGGEGSVTIPLDGLCPTSVRIAYPRADKYAIDCTLTGNELKLEFTEERQARMLEIGLTK